MASSESDGTDTEMADAEEHLVEDFATPGEMNEEDAEGDEDDAGAGVEATGETSGVYRSAGQRRGYRARPTHERDITVIQTPPPFLAGMRQTLFEVTAPVELKPEEFELFWPFVDNVWVRQHKAGTDRTGTSSTDYYACRLQRPTYTPREKGETESPQEGKQKRKKKAREGGTCQARVKTVTYRGAFEKITVVRVGHHAHTHDLDAIDKLKRNTVVMDVARTEVQKGYLPTSVFNAMRADPDKLAVVGGKFMKVNDVRNASQSWRSTHSAELRPHPDAALSKQYAYTGARISGTMAGAAAVDERAAPTASETTSASAPPPPPVGTNDTSHPKALPPDTLFFPPPSAFFLAPYLPAYPPAAPPALPHVTLSYASSLDSLLALGRTIPTPISSLPTRAMTHYLRSRHDAILIGVGTAICDDPTLNCRLAGAGGYGGVGWSSHPRPVILDPGARWDPTPDSAILKAAAAGRGRAPWVVVQPRAQVPAKRIEMLQRYGGKFVMLPNLDARFRLRWEDVLRALHDEGIRSVLVEGGATVASEMLGRAENRAQIHSVILTLAPTYLGQGGVPVGPPRQTDPDGKPVPALRFVDVRWCPLGEDVVMCARMPESPGVDAQAVAGLAAGQAAAYQQRPGVQPTPAPASSRPASGSASVPAPMANMQPPASSGSGGGTATSQHPEAGSDPVSLDTTDAATATAVAGISPDTPSPAPGAGTGAAGRGRGRGGRGARGRTGAVAAAAGGRGRGRGAGGGGMVAVPGGDGGPPAFVALSPAAAAAHAADRGVMSQAQAQEEMRRRMEMYARGQMM